MPEAVVTLTVITVMVTVILVAVAALQGAQRTLDAQLLAQQVLSEQVAAVRATDFVDVMQADAAAAGPPALCDVGAAALRAGAPAIAPASVVLRQGREFTVTRSVVWDATGDAATCDAVPNDRADMKRTTITVSWEPEESATRTLSASVLSSRTSDTTIGPQIVVTR